MTGNHWYTVMVMSGAFAALLIRRVEGRRLNYVAHPGYRYVGVSALLGAIVGAKVGMVFYLSWEEFGQLWLNFADFRTDGKTILGALTGGYLGGELGKRLAGVQFSTGDAFAVALPVGQAFGRVGCHLAGCCWGSECSLPWAIAARGSHLHPVQLYEAILCLGLAATLYAIRKQARPAGFLFRYYLIGYAAIRFGIEFFRGEPRHMLGPLSWGQVYCLVCAAVLLWSVRRKDRASLGTELPAHS